VNTRYETEHDLRDLNNFEEPDREISLSATTILGIFFALALLCAVFFGFGYSQGRHSVPPAAASADSTIAPPETTATKPSPRSVASQPVVPPADKQSTAALESAIVPLESDSAQPDAQKQEPQPVQPPERVKPSAPTPRAEEHPVPSTIASTKTPAPIPAAPIASSSGTLVVQVAAMSHQEDADVVAADLKHRGYPVTVRHTPQDKLFHVQIGPFASKKEADNIRQRLQTDGYNNAIVK
jgi:cell division septation protein DedD